MYILLLSFSSPYFFPSCLQLFHCSVFFFPFFQWSFWLYFVLHIFCFNSNAFFLSSFFCFAFFPLSFTCVLIHLSLVYELWQSEFTQQVTEHCISAKNVMFGCCQASIRSGIIQRDVHVLYSLTHRDVGRSGTGLHVLTSRAQHSCRYLLTIHSQMVLLFLELISEGEHRVRFTPPSLPASPLMKKGKNA